MRAVLAASAVVALVVVAGCAAPANRTTTNRPATTTTVPATSSVTATSTTPSGVTWYVAVLKPVNRSGVVGEAVVMQRGSTLYVQVRARGMVPNQQHAQHIHGLAGEQTSTCPPLSTTSVIQESQAEKYYGQVLLPLEPFPTASASGTITYRGTLAASSDVPTITLLPLKGRAIVLHGLMVNGTYQPSVPVACGELKVLTSGKPPAGFSTMTPGGGAMGATTSP